MTVAIEVAVGLSFLYLLLALIVTTVQELIASWTSKRARDLYDAIEQMLQEGRTVELYNHPLIRNLRRYPNAKDKAGNPSYIPSETFALALIDVLQGERTASQASGADRVLIDAKQLVDEIKDPTIQRALQTLVSAGRRTADRLDDDVVVLGRAIEDWFNSRMTRASGWYKRKAQTIALLLAAAVVALSNADTIHVATTLWRDSAIREAVVERAKAFHDAQPAQDSPAKEQGTPARALHDPIKELEDAAFPLGWSEFPAPQDLPLKILGFLLSALAVSLGSAFWFDVLGRILQLRATGPRVSGATGNTTDDD